MQAAKNFQSGMMLMRQLEFALFDFRLHLEYDPQKGACAQALLDELRHALSVVPVAPYNRFQHSFNHIFSGGYAAGYYSYLWAEVLAKDAFSKFVVEGIFNANTGQAFLEKVLEKGASVDAQQLFRDFRGRDPELKPFLQDHGIQEQ
jgi:oligopeptidase A